MSDLVRILRARLAGGTVQFTFRKISGETRPASGTTCFDLIPDAFRPKTDGRRTTENLVVYFDLDRMAWRSLRSDNLVSIDD